MPVPGTVADILLNPLRVGCPQEWGSWYQSEGEELMDEVGESNGGCGKAESG